MLWGHEIRASGLRPRIALALTVLAATACAAIWSQVPPAHAAPRAHAAAPICFRRVLVVAAIYKGFAPLPNRPCWSWRRPVYESGLPRCFIDSGSWKFDDWPNAQTGSAVSPIKRCHDRYPRRSGFIDLSWRPSIGWYRLPALGFQPRAIFAELYNSATIHIYDPTAYSQWARNPSIGYPMIYAGSSADSVSLLQATVLWFCQNSYGTLGLYIGHNSFPPFQRVPAEREAAIIRALDACAPPT